LPVTPAFAVEAVKLRLASGKGRVVESARRMPKEFFGRRYDRQASLSERGVGRAREDVSHEQPTARNAVDGQEVFQITHPFHPLFGREFVLIERRNAWGEERVYFHDDSGRVRRLTAAWTNAVAPDPFERVSAGRSHFRVDHLLHLVALIARQNEAKGALKASPRPRKVSSK